MQAVEKGTETHTISVRLERSFPSMTKFTFSRVLNQLNGNSEVAHLPTEQENPNRKFSIVSPEQSVIHFLVLAQDSKDTTVRPNEQQIVLPFTMQNFAEMLKAAGQNQIEMDSIVTTVEKLISQAMLKIADDEHLPVTEIDPIYQDRIIDINSKINLLFVLKTIHDPAAIEEKLREAAFPFFVQEVQGYVLRVSSGNSASIRDFNYVEFEFPNSAPEVKKNKYETLKPKIAPVELMKDIARHIANEAQAGKNMIGVCLIPYEKRMIFKKSPTSPLDPEKA
jgi:hypothetical protein